MLWNESERMGSVYYLRKAGNWVGCDFYRAIVREEDKEHIITALAKTLSIWTDWKEQQDDLRKMMTGGGYYTGPGGKFGRLIREFHYRQDLDRAEIDDEIDSFITKGDYENAVKIMVENERYESVEGVSGRIMKHKTPLLYYIEVMSKKEQEGTIMINQTGSQKITIYPTRTGRRTRYNFKGVELIPVE